MEDVVFVRAPLPMIIDVNDSEASNTLGKGVFMFSITSQGVQPYWSDKSDDTVNKQCLSHGGACRAKIVMGRQIAYW